MSDIPENYFINGVELKGFRREVSLDFVAPGEAKKKKSRGPGSASKIRKELLNRDGGFCHYCPQRLVFPNGYNDGNLPNIASIEHIYPKSLGGSNSRKNLVLACRKCNSNFGSKLNKCACDFCVRAIRNEGFQ